MEENQKSLKRVLLEHKMQLTDSHKARDIVHHHKENNMSMTYKISEEQQRHSCHNLQENKEKIVQESQHTDQLQKAIIYQMEDDSAQPLAVVTEMEDLNIRKDIRRSPDDTGQKHLTDLQPSNEDKSPTKIPHDIITHQIGIKTIPNTRAENVNEDDESNIDKNLEHTIKQGDLSPRNKQKSIKKVKK